MDEVGSDLGSALERIVDAALLSQLYVTDESTSPEHAAVSSVYAQRAADLGAQMVEASRIALQDRPVLGLAEVTGACWDVFGVPLFDDIAAAVAIVRLLAEALAEQHDAEPSAVLREVLESAKRASDG